MEACGDACQYPCSRFWGLAPTFVRHYLILHHGYMALIVERVYRIVVVMELAKERRGNADLQ